MSVRVTNSLRHSKGYRGLITCLWFCHTAPSLDDLWDREKTIKVKHDINTNRYA